MIQFKTFATLTRLEHTLFGLPFIVIGGLLPFSDPKFVATITVKTWVSCALVVPAFMAARISGMAFNQYLDRHIDALNPRTQSRMIPKGAVQPKVVLKLACISLMLFLLLAACIHPLCFAICCFSAAMIVIYSFMKRIHYSCHFVLGLIHFLGPLTAFVAIRNAVDLPIILVSLAAFFLNSSNDILYALQDMAFDCKYRLHSIPSHFGMNKSVKISATLQALCVLCLILFGIVSQFSWVYYCAPCIAILCFVLFHRKRQTHPGFFFRAQIGVSIATAIFTFMGYLWRV